MTIARTLVVSALLLAAQAAAVSGIARAQAPGDDQAAPPAPQGAEPPAAEPAEKQLSPREARRRAQELDLQFQRLFQDEKFDEAIPVLEEIVRLDPQPLHFYNLGLIHYHRGDKEKSLQAFERFLAENPRDRSLIAEAKRFERILQRDVEIIREARRQSESLVTESEKRATEARAAAEQANAALAEAQSEAQAARQAEAQAQAERDQLRTVLQSTPSGAGSGKRTIGASLILVGGLALGAGAFFGLDAMAANDEAESATEWAVSYDWLIGRAEDYNQRALIFGGAGAALIIGGATLYYLGERDAQKPLSERAGVGIAPALTPSGAGVSLHGNF
jgi:tetratricopeptide (TPR) repeat protein